MVRLDPTTGQQLLGGMGELHLEVVAERIRREHKLELYTGPMQVARPDLAFRSVTFHLAPEPSTLALIRALALPLASLSPVPSPVPSPYPSL